MKKNYKELLEQEIEFLFATNFPGEKTREGAIKFIQWNKGNMFELANADAIFFTEDDNDYSECDFESMFKLSVSYSEEAKVTSLYKKLNILGYYKDEKDALANLSRKLRYNELLEQKNKSGNDIAMRTWDTYAILNYDENAKTGTFGEPNKPLGSFKIEKVEMY